MSDLIEKAKGEFKRYPRASTPWEMIEELERLTTRLNQSREYSCNLQRMIEHHCRGKLIPEPLASTSPHLSAKINKALADTAQEEDV